MFSVRRSCKSINVSAAGELQIKRHAHGVLQRFVLEDWAEEKPPNPMKNLASGVAKFCERRHRLRQIAHLPQRTVPLTFNPLKAGVRVALSEKNLAQTPFPSRRINRGLHHTGITLLA